MSLGDTQAFLVALKLHNCIIFMPISLLWTHLCEFKASQLELHRQPLHGEILSQEERKEQKTKMRNRSGEEGGCKRIDGPELRRLRGIAGASDLRWDASKMRSQLGRPRSGPHNKTSGVLTLQVQHSSGSWIAQDHVGLSEKACVGMLADTMCWYFRHRW